MFDLNELREKINLAIYDSKPFTLRLFRYLKLIVSIFASLVLVYYYGFPQNLDSEKIVFTLIQNSFVFYVVHYLIKLIFHFQPREMIKENWFEGIIMLILIVEGIHFQFGNKLILERMLSNVDVHFLQDFSAIFIQAYFFTVIVFEIFKTETRLPRFKMNPASIFIATFVLIIGAGTGLLMLPEMTNLNGSMDFLDALFTSTSATCVTGLIVEDTPTFFTFKGQVVILILVKLGGLNIIAFGAFVALFSKLGLGIKQHSVIEDFVNKDNALNAKSMFRKVIRWSLLIEFVGAAVMYFLWQNDVPFESAGDKVFSSVFHSISAFNNAGLSLFTDGMYNEAVRTNYLVHLCITVLVFLGALGFMSIFELFSFKKLRERMRHPWKQINFSTKIALYFSVVLVVIGTVFYYFLEKDNTLKGQNFVESMITSLFQSVTRTSGFNSVDIGSIGAPMLFLLVILMFIGSSSSSTGGGIKTSTFAIIWSHINDVITGRKQVQLFKRTISSELVSRAYSVFFFFIAGNTIGIFLLLISEHEILATDGRGVLDLIFEEVSAFGTVGLSTGITADLSMAGKIIIILSMFVGRVGTLTVAFALRKETKIKNYQYPEGHTMVG